MSPRIVRLKSRPGSELRIYPNVVHLFDDGTLLARFSIDQWAEMASAVGVMLMPEPESADA